MSALFVIQRDTHFQEQGQFLDRHCFLIYSRSRSLLEYQALLSVVQRAVRAAETSRKKVSPVFLAAGKI
jgi:hypothetical protein